MVMHLNFAEIILLAIVVSVMPMMDCARNGTPKGPTPPTVIVGALLFEEQVKVCIETVAALVTRASEGSQKYDDA